MKKTFEGEASMAAIENFINQTKEAQADFMIGIGGGKMIDTVKAVAHELKLPLVIIPTLASTDAPTSRMSVIYKEDGSLENYLFYGSNPDLVMVDSQVVANAPSRFLAAGFGDALSTWIEARAIHKAGQTTILQARQTLTSLAIAENVKKLFSIIVPKRCKPMKPMWSHLLWNMRLKPIF